MTRLYLLYSLCSYSFLLFRLVKINGACFFICSVTEDLSSAGSVKDSSCRTWICCWTGRTSTACCWELSAWSWKPRTRMHRFSWGSWRTRWSRDSTASTRHVESRNTPAASAARLWKAAVFTLKVCLLWENIREEDKTNVEVIHRIY